MNYKDAKGLTVFEINEHGNVRMAEYKRGSIFISFCDKESESNETIVLIENINCVYIKALNKSNAIRKYKTRNKSS